MKKDKSDLLSPYFIKQMFTMQSHFDETSVAISWFMGEMNVMSYLYHQGSGLGYVAEVRIYPKENIGSIILMNHSEYDALLMLNVLGSEFVSHTKKNMIKAP